MSPNTPDAVLLIDQWFRLVLIALSAAAVSAAQAPTSGFADHLRLGEYYLEHDAAGRAVSEFEAAVRLAPDRAEGHYNLAHALRLWGDVRGAEEAVRRAIKIQPHFPEAHFLLGLLLGDQVGSEHLGLSEFETATAQKPGYAEAHFNIGVIRWKAGETALSLNAFDQAVGANPQSAEYRVRLARALAGVGRHEEAVTHLRRATELDPALFEAHYHLGRELLRQGGNEQAARKHLETAQELKEKGPTAVAVDQSHLLYRQGLAALERGRYEEATNLLTAALDGGRNEAEIRSALGIAYQRSGDRAKAGSEFRRVVALDPTSLDGRLNLGTLLVFSGDASAAEEQFRECLKIDPNFIEAHFNLGLVFASRRRWDDAIDSLRNALRIQPNHNSARWNLARVLRDSGERPAALSEYRRSCSADRSVAEACIEYAELLASSGDRSAAITTLTEVAEYHPTHLRLHDYLVALLEQSKHYDAAAHQRRKFQFLSEQSEFQQGIQALNAGEFERAAKIFRAVLDRHPDMDEVRRPLATALFSNQAYDEATAEYRRLLTGASNDVNLRLNLATTLWKGGLLAEARKELNHVLIIAPDSARAYHQIALTYWEAGERDRAMEFFHQARRLDPSVTIPQ